MGNLSSGLNKPCDIFKVIKMVEGTRATSSSRSESWFIYVDNGGKTLEKLFMKFFLSPRSNFEDIVDNKTILKYVDNRKTYVGRQSLDYESRVYSKIISVILREGVNPSFVSPRAVLTDCSFDTLMKILIAAVGLREDKNLVINQLHNNLKRNLIFNYGLNIAPRPSIEENSETWSNSITGRKPKQTYDSLIRSDRFSVLKFSGVVLEPFRDRDTSLDNFLRLHLYDHLLYVVLNQAYDNDLNGRHNKDILGRHVREVLVHLSAACHVMYGMGMSHNDLHGRNIQVGDVTEDKAVMYRYGGKRNIFKPLLTTRIFDFDRSYVKELGPNPLLADERVESETGTTGFCKYSNQCNKVYKNFDFGRVLNTIAIFLRDILIDGKSVPGRAPLPYPDRRRLLYRTAIDNLVSLVLPHGSLYRSKWRMKITAPIYSSHTYKDTLWLENSLDPLIVFNNCCAAFNGSHTNEHDKIVEADHVVDFEGKKMMNVNVEHYTFVSSLFSDHADSKISGYTKAPPKKTDIFRLIKPLEDPPHAELDDGDSEVEREILRAIEREGRVVDGHEYDFPTNFTQEMKDKQSEEYKEEINLWFKDPNDRTDIENKMFEHFKQEDELIRKHERNQISTLLKDKKPIKDVLELFRDGRLRRLVYNREKMRSGPKAVSAALEHAFEEIDGDSDRMFVWSDDGVSQHDSKDIDPRRYRPDFASQGLGSPPLPITDDIVAGVPIPSDKKEKEYVILPNGILALCGETYYPVPSELKDQKVLKINSTYGAFAALLEDGRVVAWGDADDGGDNSAVQGELKDQVVQQIYSTGYAFAAVLGNGRVVTWGEADFGGDSSAVQGELKDQKVQQIYSTDRAFAAVLGNDRVVTWGRADFGGDSRAVQGELKDQVVEHIYSTQYAFAALLGNGRVVTWGRADAGGDIPRAVQGELKDQVVQQIYSTGAAFAALLEDGRVVTWGLAGDGGDSSKVQGELKDQVVQQIYSTDRAFAALLEDGRVVTWGSADFGGDSRYLTQGELRGQTVKKIYSNYGAFAALLEDGRVVTWGDRGGDSSAVQDELKGQTVKHIYSSRYAFVALLGNGRVVVWGRTVWRERIKRVIQLPLGRTVIDVVGNSVILDDWRALSISPRSPSILDSLTYDRFIEKRIYRKTLGNASFNTHPSTGSRRQVLQDTRMLQHIMSFLTPGEVTDFQGVQPGTNTRLN